MNFSIKTNKLKGRKMQHKSGERRRSEITSIYAQNLYKRFIKSYVDIRGNVVVMYSIDYLFRRE